MLRSCYVMYLGFGCTYAWVEQLPRVSVNVRGLRAMGQLTPNVQNLEIFCDTLEIGVAHQTTDFLKWYSKQSNTRAASSRFWIS
jgi:hypothetical protein